MGSTESLAPGPSVTSHREAGHNFGHPSQTSDTLPKLRTVFPNFGHPSQTSDTLPKLRTPFPNFVFTNHNFLQVTIVNKLSVLKLFPNGDLLFSYRVHRKILRSVNFKITLQTGSPDHREIN